MKKRWIVLSAALLLTGGCRGETSAATLTFTQDPIHWKWEQGDVHAAGTMQKISPELEMLTFEEPETLRGLSCRTTPEGCSYSLGDLTCRMTGIDLPENAIPRMLMTWRQQTEQDPPALSQSEDGNGYHCKGSYGSGTYALQTDADGKGRSVQFIF